MSALQEIFDQKAHEWENYTQTPLGHLRELLNYRFLEPYLPPTSALVLDVGCGTGGVGIRLATRGYKVHLVDLSPAMLSIAREKATAAGVLDLLQFSAEDINEIDLALTYDVVICHTLLEYVPNVAETVQRLSSLLKLSGVLSLAFVNRHADVLKQVLIKGDIQSALAAIDNDQSAADLFGVPRKTFDNARVQKVLQEAGLTIQAEHGVRIFADYLKSEDWSKHKDLEDLVSLEIEASQRSPFKHMGRYSQIICTPSR